MTLVKKPDYYETEFMTGTSPSPSRLMGTWSIKIVSWQLPLGCRWVVSLAGSIMTLLGWKKIFSHRVPKGCNSILRRPWGLFAVTSDYASKTTVLSYQDWPVVDRLRTTSRPDLMVGRFYWREKFRAWFSLERIES